MDPTLNLVDNSSLARDLKCSLCNGYLSVLPIYHGSSTGYLCGRCTKGVRLVDMVSQGHLQRAQAYEMVARFIQFPCHNVDEGCNTTLKWTEVVQHEAECTIPMKCLFNPCEWYDTRNQLSQHFFNSHLKSFRNFPITLTNSEELRCFTKVFDCVFFIVCYWDRCRGCVRCSVRCVHVEHSFEHKFYKFGAEVRQGDTPLLNGVKDETQAIRQMPFSDTTYLNLSTQGMVHTGGSLSCTLVILRKSDEEIANVERSLNITSRHKKDTIVGLLKAFTDDVENKLAYRLDELMRVAQCPVCSTALRTPIYICFNSHSMCHDCKIKAGESCPSCPTGVIMRNYALENVLELFESS